MLEEKENGEIEKTNHFFNISAEEGNNFNEQWREKSYESKFRMP